MPRLRVILFGCVAFVALISSASLLLKMSPQLTGPRTLPAPPREHFDAVLSDGVRVELVGLAPLKLGPQVWWKPDGRGIEAIPLLTTAEQSQFGNSSSNQQYRVLVTVHGGNDDMAVATGMSGSQIHQSLPTGESFRVCSGFIEVQPDQTTATIRFGIANESRSPTRVLDATGRRIPPAAGAPHDPIPEDILVTEVRRLEGLPTLVGGVTTPQIQTNLVYEIPNRWRQPDMTIIAIDQQGQSHPCVGGGGSFSTQANSAVVTGDFYFPIPPSQIERFEYQFRLYRHWVEFENVSLQPGQITPVKITVDP